MTPPKKENKVEKMSKTSQKISSPALKTEATKVEGGFKHVFENLKKHFEPEKVDEFQRKWLALPENRKKYENVTDAPQVAIEEVIAMTNDLIQYMQGQQGGNSGFLKRIKSGFSKFFKNPAGYVQEKAEAGKEMAVEMKDSAVDKVKDVATNVKDSAVKKVSNVTEKAQDMTKEAVKGVTQKAKKVTKSVGKTAQKTVKKAVKNTKTTVGKTVDSAKKTVKPIVRKK